MGVFFWNHALCTTILASMAWIKRRDFIKGLAATGAVALTGCGGTEFENQISGEPGGSTSGSGTVAPNIVLVLVDEMRYPVHFPAGVGTADEYIARFMPNLSRHLWQEGVKFSNYRVAAGACTPSRSVILTGLYTQQSWLLTTISGTGDDIPPSLPSEYPTYGSLLKANGYQTPYFGKFHVSADTPYESDQCPFEPENYLAPWGFDECVCPDPGGTQGQGNSADGLAIGDQEVADQAIDFFSTRRSDDPPFCATVSFVNPHDYQFFWGGTEPVTYAELFAQAGESPLIPYDTRIVSEANPPAQGFPDLPPNWESFQQLEANKPRSQAMFNEANQAIFGACSFDPASQDFVLEPSRVAGGQIFKGTAPYRYWKRGQDSYAQVLGMVDQQIGRVLDAIPDEVRANTVVVFTSDHGDYVGSHGFLAGKVGTVYEEALRVPLVVRDYTGRFATETGTYRQQLASSVDLLRLLVTLGYNGDTGWLQGELDQLYGERLDLLKIVASNQAPGRELAVYTTDEFVNRALNYNLSPTHIVGLVKGAQKLGIYNHWAPGSTRPVTLGRELEFYDLTTPAGAAEMESLPTDSRALELLELWETEVLPNEVRRQLPESLRQTQEATRQAYLNFVQVRDDIDLDLSRIREGIPFSLGIDRVP